MAKRGDSFGGGYPRQWQGAQWAGLFVRVPSWPEPPGAPRGGAGANPGHCEEAPLITMLLYDGRLDQLACAVGADRAVGKDHDRRFETLRAMHGHDAHLVAALARFAFQIAIAGIEPADEALQAGGMRAGIGIRRIEQFVDRIIRLTPQPRDQLAASVHRTDQHPVEQLLRAVVIGAAQDFAQGVHGLHHPLGIAFAQMLP